MPAAVAKSTHGPFSIPSLDGLRFIAVMVVFIGHGATAPGIWPGHVGVTVFFFLSGYLITTLLRREYDRNDRISLGNFYLRRALRILPPAYITIALAVLVGQLGILSSTQNIWGVLAEILNVTNYYMIFADSSFGDAYRGLPPETSMLWSLAVEEHFYLLFPAVLILMLRRHLTYRRIGWILVATCVLILGWRIVVAFGDPSFFRIYTASDVRFDGLLAGAALALLWNPALGDPRPLRISDRVLKFWLAPTALALGVTVTMLPSAVRLTLSDSIVYICLVPIFWLVIIFPEGPTGRFLNNRVVAHIGVLSFSIYLLHRLVIALVELVITVPLVSDVCALLVTLALAQIMYVAVERPAGRVRRRLEARLALAKRPRSEGANDEAPATDAPRA